MRRMERYTARMLPMTAAQIQVAQETADEETKRMARRQKRDLTLRVPYYPTLQDRMEAAEWLANSGWGKALQVVTLEDEQVQGFTILGAWHGPACEQGARHRGAGAGSTGPQGEFVDQVSEPTRTMAGFLAGCGAFGKVIAADV